MTDAQLQWTRASLMAKATDRLLSGNIGDARRNVEWILCELLKCNRASLYAYPESLVKKEIADPFWALINRRLEHEPLQYILGYTEFCGLKFSVTPAVLIPRPETEVLIGLANDYLKNKKQPTVLDIGSGSGCIPVAIKHFNPDASVFSCDISEDALAVARQNANDHKAEVNFFQHDILSETLPLPASLSIDLIVSNPPYIPEEEYHGLEKEVLNFEPGLALSSGPDPLLFYKAISKVAAHRMATDGTLLLETHCDYASDVAQLVAEDGFSDAQVHKDLADRDRFVTATWHPAEA